MNKKKDGIEKDITRKILQLNAPKNEQKDIARKNLQLNVPKNEQKDITRKILQLNAPKNEQKQKQKTSQHNMSRNDGIDKAMSKNIGMEKAIIQILEHIAAQYKNQQKRAAKLNDDQRKKMGAQMAQKQISFLKQVTVVIGRMKDLVQRIGHEQSFTKPELKSYPPIIKQCYQDMLAIKNRQNILFKVSKQLLDLIQRTNQHITAVNKQVGIAKETKFLCCGTDGAKKFNQVMQQFKLSSYQWSLLAHLQPKDNVETFIPSKFSANDYTATIRQILSKLWPKEIIKQIIKEVPKIINSGGKPSRLIEANEYIYGINREQNPSFGLKIYHEEAKNGDPAAASFLGQAYEEGVLIPKDIVKSISNYKKAMDGKDKFGTYRYAMALIKGEFKEGGANEQDIRSGFNILKQIESNCPQAQTELGELYEKGRFHSDKAGLFKMPIDLKAAISCYEAARSRQVPRASNNLGVLYINNRFLSQSNPNSRVETQSNAFSNLEKGMKYLEEAELLGFPQAYYNLGCVYESGLMGRKNLEQALMCYYKGGLKGDMPSRLKFAYQLMNQTSILKEQYQDHYRIAHRWLDSIVHKTNIMEENSPASSVVKGSHSASDKAEALFYLGLMYEYGFGVEKSPKTAINYFSEASTMGLPAAKNKIGDCYFSGFGVREDRKMAIGMYAEAAKLENSDAYVNLGTIFLNGIPGVVEKDYSKAYEHFVKAMKLDNSNALIHLSYMYKNSIGLEEDREMARKLLEESAANKNPTALYMLKEFGGEFDENVLFNNLDNEIFATPRRINLKEVVPYISGVKL